MGLEKPDSVRSILVKPSALVIIRRRDCSLMNR